MKTKTVYTVEACDNPLKTVSVSQSVFFATSVYPTSLCNQATPLIRPLYFSHVDCLFRAD